MTYQLAIIGGGPAGYTAAHRALKAGMSVVLFEQKQLGGTCLNEGCIPTKCLLYGAKQYHQALTAQKYGVNTQGVSFDYARMQQRKTKVVRKLVAGVRQKVSGEQALVVAAEAKVIRWSETFIDIQAADVTYQAERLLVCTGSDNFTPPISGVDLPHVWDSSDALAATTLPERIAIIGGGVIGMEFACLFNTLGVHVTVIEMLDEILGNMDAEVSTLLRQTLQKEGIDIKLKARVTGITEQGVNYELDGEQQMVEADHVLVSVGRRPRIQGLEALQLAMQGRGIGVDVNMRTSKPNVWAAGDVTGQSMLAHTAVREAEVAVDNMLGVESVMRYDAIPGVVYTNPEVAGVGQTEAMLQKQGVEYDVRRLPMTFAGRFVAENEGVNGLCKLLVDKQTDRILGVHMLGNYASEIINQAAQAITCGLTAHQWSACVFAHPTVSEILKEACE
ncbi:MAG: dihydrolipoyl dehydrogenase [Paludibacteraceae bacterium]|nr:dihydrolipoyl dehydrogenase [Paludibacteraceae bacterium]